MPFQWPGTLDDETAWKLTAFLMRENGWWDGAQPLTAENALQAVIPSHLPEATGAETAASASANGNPPWRGAVIHALVLCQRNAAARGRFFLVLARWRWEGQ